MLDPRIILAGQQPDLVNAFARGQEVGARSGEIRNQNALRGLLQEQGPNILAGEENALNALSRFDPQAALGVQDSRLQIQQREQALVAAKEQARQRAATVAAGLSAQERAAEAETLDRALAAGTAARTPEEWDAVMRQFGAEDLVGGFEQRDMIIASALGLKEALEMNAPPAPQSPEGKLQADINAGLVDPSTMQADQSAAEQRVSRLMETGIDRNTAIGIVDGRLVESRDPVSGTAQIVDRATGKVVGGGQTEQPQPPEPNQVELPGGDGVERDFSGSTGIPGLISSIQNAAASAVGQPLPAPEVENAINTLNSINRDTMVILSSGISGRPSNFSMEQVQAFLPQATGIFQGPERTLSRARETRAAIERDIRSTMEVANNPDQFRPIQVTEARQRLLSLREIAGQWDSIIQGLQGRTPRQGGQGGAQRLRFNPETGQLEPVQ